MNVLQKWFLRLCIKITSDKNLLREWHDTLCECHFGKQNGFLLEYLELIRGAIYERGLLEEYIDIVEQLGAQDIMGPTAVLQEYLYYSINKIGQSRIDIYRRAIHGNLELYILNFVLPLMSQETKEKISNTEIDDLVEAKRIYATRHMNTLAYGRI